MQVLQKNLLSKIYCHQLKIQLPNHCIQQDLKENVDFLLRDSLIDHYIGKIVDIIMKSVYCKSCEFWKNKEGTTEYEEWSKSHINYQINHEGSAGEDGRYH